MFTVIYILIKYFAYVGWSLVAIKYFKLNMSPSKMYSYGFIRLLLGVIAGPVITLLAILYSWIGSQLGFQMWAPSSTAQKIFVHLSTYFLCYVPVQWITWTIFLWIINRDVIKKENLKSIFWRLGGIILSTVLDAPFLFFYSLFAIQGFC